MNHQAQKSHQIGDFLVTVLSDGEMNVSLALLAGIDEKSAEKIQTDAGVINADQIDINCYLIQGNGHTILVDSGTGGLNGHFVTGCRLQAGCEFHRHPVDGHRERR